MSSTCSRTERQFMLELRRETADLSSI
jgi:hypothetical protein